LAALAGTLAPPQMEIPVIGTSFAVGEELHTLLGTGPVTVHIAVDASIVGKVDCVDLEEGVSTFGCDPAPVAAPATARPAPAAADATGTP